jgi:hypothetical protein
MNENGDRERDRVCAQVEANERTPQEAEAWAASKGQSPFESRPDVSGFDPSKEYRWTLPMAAAWCIWRDYEAVRDQ